MCGHNMMCPTCSKNSIMAAHLRSLSYEAMYQLHETVCARLRLTVLEENDSNKGGSYFKFEEAPLKHSLKLSH